MAKKRYKANVAIVLSDGESIAAGETFEAEEEEVAGGIEIGAVQGAPGRPPKSEDDDED